jgi:hypothetical protein
MIKTSNVFIKQREEKIAQI